MTVFRNLPPAPLKLLSVLSYFTFQLTGTGIEDINDAFEGSLTFQPAVPSGEVDIVVSFSTVFEKELLL